jgi:hypothetical protein
VDGWIGASGVELTDDVLKKIDALVQSPHVR